MTGRVSRITRRGMLRGAAGGGAEAGRGARRVTPSTRRIGKIHYHGQHRDCNYIISRSELSAMRSLVYIVLMYILGY